MSKFDLGDLQEELGAAASKKSPQAPAAAGGSKNKPSPGASRTTRKPSKKSKLTSLDRSGKPDIPIPAPQPPRKPGGQAHTLSDLYTPEDDVHGDVTLRALRG